MNVELMLSSFPELAAAIPKTLALAVISLLAGFVIAVGVALMRLSATGVLAATAKGYIYIFRSSPLLVQLFLIYYGSGQFRPLLESIGLWILFKEPWFCAILALALNTSAYTAEIIRGGVLSIPGGQIDAARACGLSGLLLLRHIVAPLAFRQALPAYGNEIILMLKSTSLASTITLMEITGVSKKLISESWSPLEIFIVSGGIYLAINVLVVWGIGFFERRAEIPGRPRTGQVRS